LAEFKDDWKRSAAKMASYRVIVIVLDLAFVYFLTRKLDVALEFMVASNLYTSIAYFAHERVWEGISWGRANPLPQKNSGKRRS
jgi:uncharacterized membrane protein